MNARWLIRMGALDVARANIGFGEVEGDNRGLLITAMGGVSGQEWCALFAGYCYRRAYGTFESPASDERWCYREGPTGVLRPEVGAKRLTRQCWESESGFRTRDVGEVLPGDLVCWSRGRLGWQGHVGIVEQVDDDLVHTIEGNVGKFPAKVRRLTHDVRKERLWWFAGIRDY